MRRQLRNFYQNMADFLCWSFKTILLVVFLIAVDARICMNKDCTDPISSAKVKKPHKTKGVHLFVGDEVDIISKSDDGKMSEFEIGDVRGTVPSSYLKEITFHAEMENLVHVPDEEEDDENEAEESPDDSEAEDSDQMPEKEGPLESSSIEAKPKLPRKKKSKKLEKKLTLPKEGSEKSNDTHKPGNKSVTSKPNGKVAGQDTHDNNINSNLPESDKLKEFFKKEEEALLKTFEDKASFNDVSQLKESTESDSAKDVTDTGESKDQSSDPTALSGDKTGETVKNSEEPSDHSLKIEPIVGEESIHKHLSEISPDLDDNLFREEMQKLRNFNIIKNKHIKDYLIDNYQDKQVDDETMKKVEKFIMDDLMRQLREPDSPLMDMMVNYDPKDLPGNVRLENDNDDDEKKEDKENEEGKKEELESKGNKTDEGQNVESKKEEEVKQEKQMAESTNETPVNYEEHPNFPALRQKHIDKYLQAHYTDEEPSPQVIRMVEQLITDDLLKQLQEPNSPLLQAFLSQNLDDSKTADSSPSKEEESGKIPKNESEKEAAEKSAEIIQGDSEKKEVQEDGSEQIDSTIISENAKKEIDAGEVEKPADHQLERKREIKVISDNISSNGEDQKNVKESEEVSKAEQEQTKEESLTNKQGKADSIEVSSNPAIEQPLTTQQPIPPAGGSETSSKAALAKEQRDQAKTDAESDQDEPKIEESSGPNETENKQSEDVVDEKPNEESTPTQGNDEGVIRGFGNVLKSKFKAFTNRLMKKDAEQQKQERKGDEDENISDSVNDFKENDKASEKEPVEEKQEVHEDSKNSEQEVEENEELPIYNNNQETKKNLSREEKEVGEERDAVKKESKSENELPVEDESEKLNASSLEESDDKESSSISSRQLLEAKKDDSQDVVDPHRSTTEQEIKESDFYGVEYSDPDAKENLTDSHVTLEKSDESQHETTKDISSSGGENTSSAEVNQSSAGEKPPSEATDSSVSEESRSDNPDSDSSQMENRKPDQDEPVNPDSSESSDLPSQHIENNTSDHDSTSQQINDSLDIAEPLSDDTERRKSPSGESSETESLHSSQDDKREDASEDNSPNEDVTSENDNQYKEDDGDVARDDLLERCHNQPSLPACEQLRGTKIFRGNRRAEKSVPEEESYGKLQRAWKNVVKIMQRIKMMKLGFVRVFHGPLSVLGLDELSHWIHDQIDHASPETITITFCCILLIIVLIFKWLLGEKSANFGVSVYDVRKMQQSKQRILQENSENLENEIQELREELATKDSKVNSGENTVKELEEKLKDLDKIYKEQEHLEHEMLYTTGLKRGSSSVAERGSSSVTKRGSSSHQSSSLSSTFQPAQTSSHKLLAKIREEVKKGKKEQQNLHSLIDEKENEIKHADNVALRHQNEIGRQTEITDELNSRLEKVVEELDLKDGIVLDMQGKIGALHVELENMEMERRQMDKEKKKFSERCNELEETFKIKDEENAKLQDDIDEKDNEIEVLRECMAQINNGKLDGEAVADFETPEDDPDIKEQLKSERLKQILETTQALADLRKSEKEKEFFQEGYLEELEKREKAEADAKKLQEEVDKFSKESHLYKTSSSELHIKLDTLQQYFRQQETELHRKLSLEEQTHKEYKKKYEEIIGHSTSAVEETANSKLQIEDLKNEIKEMERNFKDKESNTEKEIHDLWIKFRQANRDAEEMKRDRDFYRKRLLDSETTKKRSSPIPPTGLEKSRDSPGGSDEGRPQSPLSQKSSTSTLPNFVGPRPPFMPPPPPAMFGAPSGHMPFMGRMPMGPMQGGPSPFGPMPPRPPMMGAPSSMQGLNMNGQPNTMNQPTPFSGPVSSHSGPVSSPNVYQNTMNAPNGPGDQTGFQANMHDPSMMQSSGQMTIPNQNQRPALARTSSQKSLSSNSGRPVQGQQTSQNVQRGFLPPSSQGNFQSTPINSPNTQQQAVQQQQSVQQQQGVQQQFNVQRF